MEPNGPLYHRNGVRLYPKALSVLLIAVVIAGFVAELTLGIESIIH